MGCITGLYYEIDSLVTKISEEIHEQLKTADYQFKIDNGNIKFTAKTKNSSGLNLAIEKNQKQEYQANIDLKIITSVVTIDYNKIM